MDDDMMLDRSWLDLFLTEGPNGTFAFGNSTEMCNASYPYPNNLTLRQDIELFRFIVDVYVVGSLCLFGFIGNALSIAVLYRDHDKKNTTNWLLQTLAVGDTLYLMASVFIQPLKAINTQHPDWIPGLKNIFPYMELHIWAFASIAQTITVWTVVLVTLDRFMAICRPLSTQLRSLERAKLAVALVVVLAVLYNIPRFFEREVHVDFSELCNTTTVIVRKSALRQNKIYFLVYKTVCYFIFRAIGPLLTLIVLNYKLIKALQEVRRRHEDLTRSGKHRENITLMLVVVVCVFITCTLPDLVLRIVVTFRDFLPMVHMGSVTWMTVMNVITNMLLVVNSSINFLIYCLIGKKFRKILKQMYSCGRPKAVSELSETEPLTTKTTTCKVTKLSEAEPLTTTKTNENSGDNANCTVKDGDVSL
jgi:neuropeptide Y receptor type 1